MCKLFKILIFFPLLILGTLISDTKAVDLNNVLTASDQVLYESQAVNQAISIGSNYNAGWDTTGINVAAGDTNSVSLALRNGYSMQAIGIYSDKEIKIKFYGTDINCRWGSLSGKIQNSLLPEAKSCFWEFTNLTRVTFTNTGAVAATVSLYLRAKKTK